MTAKRELKEKNPNHMNEKEKNKPLGRKSYGSIPHLPGSRMGTGDHHIHEGQAKIALETARQPEYDIIVQEKLDGSCCSVAKINGELVALGRSGYTAISSPYVMHHYFDEWVKKNRNQKRLDSILNEGERLVGEWLSQAHGTRYKLNHDPFVPFDLMKDDVRIPYDEFMGRVAPYYPTPRVIHRGPAISMDIIIARLEPSFHGALDPVEGAVWRVQKNGKLYFICKYVRPDKIDGCYIKSKDGIRLTPIWNWEPFN